MGFHSDCDEAKNIFDSICDSDIDIVAVTQLMKVFLANNRASDALSLYFAHSHLNDTGSHILALRACARFCSYDQGRQIHSNLASELQASVRMKKALIDFYGKCEDVTSALLIFDSMPLADRNSHCLNAILRALVGCDCNQKAFELYNAQPDASKDQISHRLMLQAVV